MKKKFLLLVSGGALGKVAGLLRELILAYFYGTSFVVDSIRTSQTTALIPVHFIANDALNASFLPIYSKNASDNKLEANAFFVVIFLALTGISLLISLLLIIYKNEIIELAVPGYSDNAKTLTSEMLVVMSIGIPFYMQSTLMSFAEMGNRKYYLSSMRSTIQNIGLILGTVSAFLFNSPILASWGFSGAYIFLTIFSYLYIVRNGFIIIDFKIQLDNISSLLKEFSRGLLPLLIIAVFTYLNVIVERNVASELGEGRVSSLEYAKVLMETGLYLISVPIGYIFLTELSDKSHDFIKGKAMPLINILIILLVPISVCLYLYNDIFVRILLMRGQFDLDSAQLTSDLILGMSFGFWAKIIAMFLIKILNVQSKNISLFFIMTISLTLQMTLNWLLVPLFGIKILGIADSLGSIVLLIGVIIKLKYYEISTIRILGYCLLLSLIVLLSHVFLLKDIGFPLQFLITIITFSSMCFIGEIRLVILKFIHER